MDTHTHTHRIMMKILKNTTLVKSEIFLLNEWAVDPFMTGSISIHTLYTYRIMSSASV